MDVGSLRGLEGMLYVEIRKVGWTGVEGGDAVDDDELVVVIGDSGGRRMAGDEGAIDELVVEGWAARIAQPRHVAVLVPLRLRQTHPDVHQQAQRD